MIFIPINGSLHTFNMLILPFGLCAGPVGAFYVVGIGNIGTSSDGTVGLDIGLEHYVEAETVTEV